jgi:hypothetical protein
VVSDVRVMLMHESNRSESNQIMTHAVSPLEDLWADVDEEGFRGPLIEDHDLVCDGDQ